MNNLNALLPVSPLPIGGKEINAVDGRRLHEFFELKSQFTTWIQGFISDFGFVEGHDFEVIQKFVKKGRPRKDYMISVPMAKELSMLQRNEKGKQARLYFIECDKLVQSVMVPAVQSGNNMDIVSQIGQALVMLATSNQEHSLKIQSIETRLGSIEADHQESIEALESLPEPTAEVPEITTRTNANRVIGGYGLARKWKGDDYRKAWENVYKQFLHRHHIDIPARAEKQGKQKIQVVEDLGLIEDLYALVVHLYGRAA